MRNYLKHGIDNTVLVLNAKVAQKSYGNEKRFFCPPPCVYLFGEIWKEKPTAQEKKFLPLQKVDNFDIQEAQSHICTFIGIGNSERELQPLLFDSKNFAAAKTMFISDSDKRKHFKILLRAYYRNGHEIGSFLTNNIKVISKPSKKKQSVKNSDLCIASATKVALFNRLRSQTVSTRYLYCEDGIFYASAQKWGSFYIYLVDDNGCESEEFVVQEGYLHYGATVKLVCSVTGMALPRMIIRKVEKSQVVLDASDALSQLHKCAFYFKDSDKMYLCLSQDRIIQFQASECPNEPNREIINDGACWTIISTDEAKYSWCETLGPTAEAVTPVPQIKNIKNLPETEKTILEVKGEDFNPTLRVWFDEIECDTLFISTSLLKCVIPSQNCFSSKKSQSKSSRSTTKVTIYLVRHDGVVYNTGVQYTYYNQTTTNSFSGSSILTSNDVTSGSSISNR